MHFDVRTAALDDLIERHVRLAVSLLGAHHIHARLSPWDGTRCDLLIASSDDAYGAQALELACRRGTAVIALGRTTGIKGLQLVNPETSALALAQHIRERLQGVGKGADAKSIASPSDVAPLPLPCQLAMPPLRGKAVDIQCGGHVLRLRPRLGRAYAESLLDLLNASEKLPEAECRLVVVDDRKESADGAVSASLESVLLRMTQRSNAQLPDFPDGCYRLDAWPDLGALPSLVGALRVSRLLMGNTKRMSELLVKGIGDMPRAEFNACLWAFAAADLLKTVDAAQPVVVSLPASRMREGLFSSLARRFGLWRT